MTDLPPGWAETTVGDTCEIVGGATPRSTEASFWNGDVPWITPDDLSRHRDKVILAGRRHLTRAGYESCSARMVPAGTVLYTSRAPIGYTAIAGQPVCTNQGFKSLIPPAGISSDYLYWYMRYATELVKERASGTTFPEISGKRMASVPLVVAPSVEQKRIVAAIEEQFSRLDTGVALLGRAQQNLKRARESVLQAAITGRLVSPDLESPSLARLLDSVSAIESNQNLPANWVTAALGAVARVTSGATPLRSEERYWKNGSIPWVTSALVNRETISEASEYITPAALAETSVKLMPEGTLLIAMYGEGQTRGRCSELLIEATTNQACASIILNEQWASIKPFLKLVLTASYEANRRLSSARPRAGAS